MPTGDPLCPEEVRMAKACKYRIAQKADLGDATGDYDMMQDDDRADDDPEEGVPLDDPGIVEPLLEEAHVVPRRVPVPPPLVNRTGNLGLSPRKTKIHERQDFFALMAMQMQNEAVQRAHAAREQAAFMAQMQTMIAGLATAYFESV